MFGLARKTEKLPLKYQLMLQLFLLLPLLSLLVYDCYQKTYIKDKKTIQFDLQETIVELVPDEVLFCERESQKETLSSELKFIQFDVSLDRAFRAWGNCFDASIYGGNYTDHNGWLLFVSNSGKIIYTGTADHRALENDCCFFYFELAGEPGYIPYYDRDDKEVFPPSDFQSVGIPKRDIGQRQYPRMDLKVYLGSCQVDIKKRPLKIEVVPESDFFTEITELRRWKIFKVTLPQKD